MYRLKFFSKRRITILSMIPGLLMFCLLSLTRAEGAAGNPWEIQFPDVLANWSLNDVWAVSDHNAFVVGYGMNGGIIGHYDGQTWKTMETYIMAGDKWGELMSIWGSSENNIFAVGYASDTNYQSAEVMILHYDGYGWSRMNTDFSGWLFDVWGSEPDDVFAVGTEGLILHWDGSSWTKMNVESIFSSATSVPDLNGVWGDGPNNVFAVGSNTVLHYQYGQWSLMPDVPPSDLRGIVGVPGGDIWAVGDCILRYHNGVWADVTPNDLPEGALFYNITGNGGGDLMAVGSCYGLVDYEGLVVRYNGQTWHTEENVSPLGELNSAWLGPDNRALVVGLNYELWQAIVLSCDGSTWSQFQPRENYTGTCYQIWAKSSQDVFAVGGYIDIDMQTGELLPGVDINELSRAFIARYDGQYWSPIYLEEKGCLFDIWGSPTNELFAVGYEVDESQQISKPMVLHSTDGTTWVNMPDIQNFQDRLGVVWGTSSMNVFAIGYNSTYHFDGTEWSKMELPGVDWLDDIWGSDADDVFAVGEKQGEDVILHYDGYNWTPMSHNAEGDLFKVFGISSDNVFALAGDGITYQDVIYHYNGTSWSSMDCPLAGAIFYDIWGTAPDNMFVLYKIPVEQPPYCPSGILHYNGQQWTDKGLAPIPSLLFGMGGTSTGDLFVAGEYGTIFHYAETTEYVQQKISLFKGWNLISFQVNVCIHNQQQPPSDVFFPEGIEFRQVEDIAIWLSDNKNSPIRDTGDPQKAGDWRRIISFDTNAHTLGRYKPPSVNSLDYLSAGYGYWIEMDNPGYLILTGNVIPPSTSLPLHAGWNLVGTISPDVCYYQETEDPPCGLQEIPPVNFIPILDPVVPLVFSTIDGKYDRVIGFDNKGGKSYNPHASDSVSSLRYVSPSRGYWIKMAEEGELVFPLP